MRWVFWLAVAFHLGVGVVPYSVSGLLTPPWAVAGLGVVWVAFSVLLWQLRRRPLAALAVPFGALLAWGLLVTLGDRLLGWTA